MNLLLDIEKTYKCPNCGRDMFRYVWKTENVISISDKFEDFNHIEGFQYYRYIYYKCPNCNANFHTKVHNKDNFVKELLNNPNKFW